MLKIELKYKDERELLTHISNLKKFVIIKKMSRPEHHKVWHKIYLDVEQEY